MYNEDFDGKSLSKIVFEFEKAQQSGNEKTLNDIMKQVFKNDKDNCGKVTNWVKKELIENNKVEVPFLDFEEQTIIPLTSLGKLVPGPFNSRPFNAFETCYLN